MFLLYNRPQRDQRTLYRRAGGHLSLGISSSTAPPIESSSSIESTVNDFLIDPSVKTHKRRKIKTVPTRSGEKESGKSSNNVVNVANLDIKNSKELTESNDDENNLDYGLMTLSAAGEGAHDKPNEESSKKVLKDIKKDEKQKTLSDQILEGKYGLIEKELFSKEPKAPGIISYKSNSETPNDNEKTLGGLEKDEIWLAEDHLLVIKGGTPNERKNGANGDWEPIDDYEAPQRPVKIPLNPKVPPPFPVNFEDGGPLQFIGHNKFSLFDSFANETNLFAKDQGDSPADFPQANNPNQKNILAGPGAFKNFTKDQIHEVIPPPTWLFQNAHKENDLLKQFPFNLPLPDQTFNRTEDFDEDDPALFYPPPYSFVYKTNYTNLAPVGPIVPGIILPPPPNFFSIYNPEENRQPIKTPVDVINRIKDIHLNNRLSVMSTTTSASTKTTATSPTSRDYTRKTKVSSTTPSNRLYKIKPTTSRGPSQTHTTSISQLSTSQKDFYKKTHPFDTTTLKLHPVYLPSSATTTAPPPAILKPYKQDYGTQAHPIYFEYFDARTANPIKNPFADSEYKNPEPIQKQSSRPTHQPPSNYKDTTKSQIKKPKSFYQPQFLSSTISPHPQNIDAKYLFVNTPKPEYAPAIVSPQSFPVSTESPISYKQRPLVLKPVGRFEDEISAIRQTLDFYNKKYTQKAPKVKAVYEFSFEASRHKNQDDFKPMLSYDQKMFYSPKPNINYSQLSELIKTNSYYPTTTETSVKYYRTKQSATLQPQKQQKIETSAPPMPFGQKLKPQNVNYYVRPVLKEVASSPQQQQSQKIISYPSYGSQQVPINVDHGYRTNNRNVKYRMPPQNQQQQFYGQAGEIASLINDTLVNYKGPQRPINPYSEFIDISRFPPQNNAQSVPQYYPESLHIQHQHPIYVPGPFHRPIQQHQQYQQSPVDVLKYEYPQIPQINPDSVHITFYNRPMEKSDESYYSATRN